MGSTPTRSVARLAALASAVLVLTAACATGGGTSSGPTTAASAAPTATAAVSTSAKPSGGKYGSEDEYGTRSPAPSASAEQRVGEVYEVGTGTGADGAYLTGEDGRTLYVFGNDSTNTSTCDGDCATAWPPFILADDDTLKAGDGVKGKLTTFTRKDGAMQAAYDGSPLYYYAADKAAGDTNGQGVGDVWYIAQP